MGNKHRYICFSSSSPLPEVVNQNQTQRLFMDRDETPSSTGSGNVKCCPIPTQLTILKLRQKSFTKSKTKEKNICQGLDHVPIKEVKIF